MTQPRTRTHRSYFLYSIFAVLLLIASCVLVYGLQQRENQADLNAVLQQLDYVPIAELRRGQGCWNGVVYFDGDCAIYAFYTTDLSLDEFSQTVERIGTARRPRESVDKHGFLFLNNYRRPTLTLNGTLMRAALQDPPIELPAAYGWSRTYNGHWLSVEFYEVANSPHEIALNGMRIRNNVVQVQLYTNK